MKALVALHRDTWFPTIALRRIFLASVATSGALTIAAAAEDPMAGYVVLPLASLTTNAAGIQATINGHPTVLIVDTGAAVTTIDRRLYKEASTTTGTDSSNLRPPGLPTNALLNGTKAEVGQIQNLEAGAMHFGGGPVLVSDLSGLFSRYNAGHRQGQIGGIIGEDILNHYNAVIDWRRRGIYFNTDPSKRLKLGPALVANGWTAVPMSRTDRHHFAVTSTIGNQNIQLLVDTGAVLTMLDSHLLPTLEAMRNRGWVVLSMVGGASVARPVLLKDWKIGSYTIPTYTVALERAPEFLRAETAPGKGPMAGLLGSEVLSKNSAIIDISGSTLYLKSGATP